MTRRVDVELLELACALSDEAVRGVRAGQLAQPTPCSDWDVLELMEHMVASTDFFAEAAELGAVRPDREWPSYLPGELALAHGRQVERLVAAFNAPGMMERPMAVLAGPSTPLFCLEIATSERLVHGWDLAAATGQSLGAGAEEVASALLSSPEFLAVNAEVRQNSPAPIGPEVAIASEAGPLDHLLGFLGRDPG